MIKWHGAYLIKDGKVVDKYVFPEDRLPEIITMIEAGNTEPIEEFLRKHPEEEVQFRGDFPDKLLQQTAINVSKFKMRQKIKDDYILIQLLAGYDDVISSINLLSERIIEISRIEEIKGEELDEGKELRATVNRLTATRDYLSQRIENYAEKIAPNTSFIVGPIIASRLMHYAGGLERLAKMPASTIQVLGAEDKFFQHLKKGTPCPKHGIIFQVPAVRNSHKRLRGRIARALAGKLAIAARVDYYGGEFIGDRLKNEFLRRVEEIKNDSNR